MKPALLLLTALLLSGPGARPQERKPEGKSQKPSLGPEPGAAPSLNGPHTSTTNDPRKLLHIRTVYIERIDNHLSDKLLDGLAKTGRFRVTANRNDADAVLRGTCFDSRRLKTVHSEIFINDRRSGAPIWQDIIRQPYNPPSLDNALNSTALQVLHHLAESIEEAERK